MYELIYDWDEENRNIRELFEGSFDELQAHIADLRKAGYYNISAADISAEDEEDE